MEDICANGIIIFKWTLENWPRNRWIWINWLEWELNGRPL